MIFTFIPILLLSGQFYWAWRARGLVMRYFATRTARLAAAAVLAALYFFPLAYTFGWLGNPRTSVRMTLGEALLAAPFLWWVASSSFAALAVGLRAMVRGKVRLVKWVAGRPPAPALESPSRRGFLAATGSAAVAAPYFAGAYGLLYGRLNLQTPLVPIRIRHLPPAFEGFRIAQLSDIHIGPFMTEDEIRRYAAIANSLKPDLVALTGDFVTWDKLTGRDVVSALSGLRAPFGVFGCLGNHDFWSGAQDSLPGLFQAAGIRILRQAAVSIAAHGEALNLMGVDFQTLRRMGPSAPVGRPLEGVDRLMAPGQVNILLSHNPDTFDRASELGIDLSLAGHTHGGQLALEFIDPAIAPSRIVTPYVAGHFRKAGGQLYVNRGIGTIAIPIRLGARPEIAVFELVRG